MSRRQTETEALGLHPAAIDPDPTHLRLWKLRTDIEDRLRRALWSMSAGYGVLAGVLILLCIPMRHLVDGAAGVAAFAAIVCASLCAAPLWVPGMRGLYAYFALVRSLAQEEDARAIPLLIHEAGRIDQHCKRTGREVRGALIHLLPRVGPQDRGLLNSAQRESLYRWARGTDGELALASLSALRYVAAVDAVPYLRPLADGKGLARKNEGIRDAAREVLAGLEQRLSAQAQPQELLRAASGPEQPATALLRPAQDAPTSPPDQLPRASVRPT